MLYLPTSRQNENSAIDILGSGNGEDYFEKDIIIQKCKIKTKKLEMIEYGKFILNGTITNSKSIEKTDPIVIINPSSNETQEDLRKTMNSKKENARNYKIIGNISIGKVIK